MTSFFEKLLYSGNMLLRSLLCLSILPLPLFAQEELPEMVVTASRTSRPLLELPYSATTITARQIEEFNDRTIPEALEFTPGVLVQKTTTGHGSPYIRGFTGRQNLLMIDGVRLNNSTWRSGPSQYWNTLDPLAVERMELVRSQGSVLFGSDAVGGTMNIFGKSAHPEDYADGQRFRSGDIFYRYATQGNSQVAHLSSDIGVGGKYGIHLGLSGKWYGDIRDQSMGLMKKTGYNELDYDLRSDFIIEKNTTLSFVSMTLSQNDIWRQHQTIYFNPWEGTSLSKPRYANIYDQKNIINYLKLKGDKVAPWLDHYEATLSFVVSDETQYQKDNKLKVSDDSTRVNTIGFALQMESTIGSGQLLYGTDYYHDTINSKSIITQHNGHPEQQIQGPLADDSSYDLLGLFAEYRHQLLSKKLELSGGVRWTYAAADIGRYQQGNEAASTKKDWNEPVLSGRALYKITPKTSIYAAISQAFRAPNVEDLTSFAKTAQSGTLVYGNTNLKPERFLTYELGTHYEAQQLSANFAAYYTQIQDFISGTYSQLSDGSWTAVNTNAGEGWVTGLEANASWKINNQWICTGFIGWVNGVTDYNSLSKDGKTMISDRVPLSRLMPTTGGVSLRWTHPNRKWWIEGRATIAARANRLSPGDKTDTSRIPPGGTPCYQVFSLYTGWQVSPALTWNLSFENLSNTDYRSHGSGVNEPGFGVVTSLKYHW